MNKYFNELTQELKYDRVKDFGKINESLNEIFEQVKILENVNSRCYIEELKGKESINLKELSKILKINNS